MHKPCAVSLPLRRGNLPRLWTHRGERTSPCPPKSTAATVRPPPRPCAFRSITSRPSPPIPTTRRSPSMPSSKAPGRSSADTLLPSHPRPRNPCCFLRRRDEPDRVLRCATGDKLPVGRTGCHSVLRVSCYSSCTRPPPTPRRWSDDWQLKKRLAHPISPDVSNWSSLAAPNPGDSLVFQGSAQTTTKNDLSAGTSLQSITLASPGLVLQSHASELAGLLGIRGTIDGSRQSASKRRRIRGSGPPHRLSRAAR